MSRAAALLGGLKHSRLVRDNAVWLARRDRHGVYKVVLQLASVEMVATRLPRLSMRCFDFGSSSGENLAAAVGVVLLDGWPTAVDGRRIQQQKNVGGGALFF